MRRVNVKETKELNVSRVYEFYPMNIMLEIGYNSIRYDITEDEFIENFEALIHNWNSKDDSYSYPRIAKVLVLRYKFFNTLDAVAKELGVTRERVRQIEQKGLRIMHHPNYSEILLTSNAVKELNAKVLLKEQELENYIIELQSKIDKIKNILDDEAFCKRLKEAELDEEFKQTKLGMSIIDLDLSCRAYNCVRGAGITNVLELIQKSEEDMMKIRSLGRKSLKEIRDKLHSMGLSFRGEQLTEIGESSDFEEEVF